MRRGKKGKGEGRGSCLGGGGGYPYSRGTVSVRDIFDDRGGG